jgi:hypothetical protein
MMKRVIFYFFLFFGSILVLSSHPGRTDKNGGHNGPNGYHYHNSGSGGGSSVPRNTAPVTPPPVINRDNMSLADAERGEVLIDTDNFNDAVNKLVAFVAIAEPELPCFQTMGFSRYINPRNSRRYKVFVSTRGESIRILFADDVEKKEIEIYFSRDRNRLPERAEVFISPENNACELARRWITEAY